MRWRERKSARMSQVVALIAFFVARLEGDCFALLAHIHSYVTYQQFHHTQSHSFACKWNTNLHFYLFPLFSHFLFHFFFTVVVVVAVVAIFFLFILRFWFRFQMACDGMWQLKCTNGNIARTHSRTSFFLCLNRALDCYCWMDWYFCYSKYSIKFKWIENFLSSLFMSLRKNWFELITRLWHIEC